MFQITVDGIARGYCEPGYSVPVVSNGGPVLIRFYKHFLNIKFRLRFEPLSGFQEGMSVAPQNYDNNECLSRRYQYKCFWPCRSSARLGYYFIYKEE